ncbi:MAG TPA: GNAT family N-acetyltransferase [Usitatibacteraceae bacterium]|nr:GNAT family N-acetyltransferase [Usitatibacteraceae bacterium]
MAATLERPALRWKDSYRAFVAEIAARGEEFVPFPLGFPHENFAVLLAQLDGYSRGIGLAPGFVPHSTFWLVEADEVVGCANLRHALTESLRVEGGHIGYGVRPSARGRGLAKAMLAATLREARALGIERALVTCDKANLASAGVIRANGGVLEDEAFRPKRGGVVQRWWIEVPPAP